jgi:hypothetical protein
MKDDRDPYTSVHAFIDLLDISWSELVDIYDQNSVGQEKAKGSL